jgi:hypothetical protein
MFWNVLSIVKFTCLDLISRCGLGSTVLLPLIITEALARILHIKLQLNNLFRLLLLSIVNADIILKGIMMLQIYTEVTGNAT